MSKRKSEFHQVTWEQAATCWKKKAEKLQAEVERLRPLARLGELVEAMPVGMRLEHFKVETHTNPFPWIAWHTDEREFVDISEPAKTAEAALLAARVGPPPSFAEATEGKSHKATAGKQKEDGNV